jgi:nitrogen regulatory protein PII
MKAVLIVHNVAIDGEINEALESLGVHYFTKFTDTLGRGQLSEPHLNTDVWPGVNYATFVVVEETKAKAVMQKVRQMRESLGKEGIKAFLWQIEDIT